MIYSLYSKATKLPYFTGKKRQSAWRSEGESKNVPLLSVFSTLLWQQNVLTFTGCAVVFECRPHTRHHIKVSSLLRGEASCLESNSVIHSKKADTEILPWNGIKISLCLLWEAHIQSEGRAESEKPNSCDTFH